MAIVQPTNTKRGVELDMRISPKLGPELNQEIIESVAATQRFILKPLPNWLIVTYDQFVSLHRYTQPIEGTSDRLYQTPLNVMEVEVDEVNTKLKPRDLLIVDESRL